MKAKMIGEWSREEAAVILSCEEKDNLNIWEERSFFNELHSMPEGSKIHIYLEYPVNKRKRITVEVVDRK